MDKCWASETTIHNQARYQLVFLQNIGWVSSLVIHIKTYPLNFHFNENCLLAIDNHPINENMKNMKTT
jgi:hypothetical protein